MLGFNPYAGMSQQNMSSYPYGLLSPYWNPTPYQGLFGLSSQYGGQGNYLDQYRQQLSQYAQQTPQQPQQQAVPTADWNSLLDSLLIQQRQQQNPDAIASGRFGRWLKNPEQNAESIDRYRQLYSPYYDLYK